MFDEHKQSLYIHEKYNGIAPIKYIFSDKVPDTIIYLKIGQLEIILLPYVIRKYCISKLGRFFRRW